MSVQTIMVDLILGRRSLWAIHPGNDDEEDIQFQAFVVTSLYEVPGRGKKLIVDLLAGEDMESWIAELHDMAEIARQETEAFCTEVSCRPGLAKYLKQNLGWKQKAVIMEYAQ